MNPVTMAAEYLWTQVEPATAILCACVVTYRPLFTNLNSNIFKLSSLFGKSGSVGSAKNSGCTNIDDDRNIQPQWPAGQYSRRREVVRFQDLNAKGTKGGVQVINTESYQADRQRLSVDSKRSRSIDVIDTRPKTPPKEYYS